MSGGNSSVESLLKDAEKLVSRLKTHEKAADLLLGQSDGLHKTIKAKSAYMKEITALNEVAGHRPRSELVLGIQMENQQIRRLQAENRDLRMLIDEHQSAVDVIMTKYREQMALIVAAKNVNRNGDSRNANYLDNALRQKRGKIEELASVMSRAVVVDGAGDEKSAETVKRLARENELLREMLQICATKRLNDEVEKKGDDVDEKADDDYDEEMEVETSVVTASFAGELPMMEAREVVEASLLRPDVQAVVIEGPPIVIESETT